MSTSSSDIAEISLVYWSTELGPELSQGYLASHLRVNSDREFAGYFQPGSSFDASKSIRVYRATLTSLESDQRCHTSSAWLIPDDTDNC